VGRFFRPGRLYTRYEYEDAVAQAMARPDPGYLRFPCVFTGWDNSPRRRTGASIFVNSTPARYQQWLESAARRALGQSPGDALVFVNAWNEWAEGAHLEPDDRNGDGYLAAHNAAMLAVETTAADRTSL
jgi:hypothetical protein